MPHLIQIGTIEKGENPMRPRNIFPILIAATLHSPPAGKEDSRFTQIDALLNREVDKGRTPSVQYIRFDAEGIIHSFRKGFADLETGRLIDTNTTFNAYSITKTFTALAVMQLAEQKRLSLDDAVIRHLPGAPISAEITLRHLLTHTSGLANPMPMKWIHDRQDHMGFNRNEFFRPILAEYGPKVDQPGSKFQYSNLGYVLLGQVIEAVSGMKYEDYLKEKIFSRLGLAPGELAFTAPEGNLQAVGYHSRYSASMLVLGLFLDKSKYMGKPTGSWKPFKEHYVNGAPYGGLISNADALVKYGQALLKKDGRLISEHSKSQLFEEGRLLSGKPAGMALSWFKGDLEGKTYFSHAGGGGGYYCEIRLYPDLGEGSVIVFNRSGFSDARFLDRVDKLILLN
jgi:D-alanyl-D-alanine carboxypeptidase